MPFLRPDAADTVLTARVAGPGEAATTKNAAKMAVSPVQSIMSAPIKTANLDLGHVFHRLPRAVRSADVAVEGKPVAATAGLIRDAGDRLTREMAPQKRADSAVADKQDIARRRFGKGSIGRGNDPSLGVDGPFPARGRCPPGWQRTDRRRLRTPAPVETLWRSGRFRPSRRVRKPDREWRPPRGRQHPWPWFQCWNRPPRYCANAAEPTSAATLAAPVSFNPHRATGTSGSITTWGCVR